MDVELTEDEKDSILNADSRSHTLSRVESIIAARTAALTAERDAAQREYRMQVGRAGHAETRLAAANARVAELEADHG